MKILLCSISSTHELTGIGKYNGELFDWFRKRGHQVDVLTTLPYYPYWEIYEGYRDDRYKKETVENGTIYSFRLPVKKNVTSKRQVMMDSVFGLNTFFRLPYLALKHKYDVIQLVLPPITALPAAALGKILGRSKLHVHIQDLQIEAARDLQMLPNPLLRCLEIYEKFWLRSADIVSTISYNMAKQVNQKIKIENTTIQMLENWADTESIKPIQEKCWLKKKFGYCENEFLVVYSGSIAEKHGVEQILSVAENLMEYNDIKFLVLGDGAGKKYLVKKRKNFQLKNIQFADLVPKEKLNAMLNGSDVQLILQKKSATDSFLPSKYINIMSAGVPSVVTANPDTELFNIAKANQTSLVVEPENSEQLSEAIRNLHQNKSIRQALAKNSRDYVVKNFSRDSILKRLEKTYETALPGR